MGAQTHIPIDIAGAQCRVEHMGETNAGAAQLQPDIHFSLIDIIPAEVLRAVRRERRIAISIGLRNLESFHRPVVWCALRPGAGIVKADLGDELTGYALANAGHDTRLIQAWLGHRAIQHTARYTELSPTRFKEVWR